MDYSVLKEVYDETSVLVNDIPPNVARQYELSRGVSRLAAWPDDVVFRFSAYRKQGLNLTDVVANTLTWLIVSNRFRQLLEGAGAVNLEYLPVQFKNHKGRVASKDYWIANFLVLTEAVDRQQSEFEPDAVDKNGIFSFTKLVLRDDVLKSGPVILRLKEQPRLVLVRQDLADRIRESGLTGIKLIETGQYKTYGTRD